MTLLPHETQRDLRNLAMASLSLLAYQFKCEVANILTLIDPQPHSHAPVARTSAPPADVQAEGSAPSSSADKSQAKAADDATSGSAMSEPLAPAGGPQEAEAVSRADAGRTASATSEVMDVTAGETAPVSPQTAISGEGAAAPAAGESPVIQAAEDIGAQPTGGENVDPPKNRRTTNLDAALVGGTRVGETTDSTVGSGALSDFDKAVLALHQAEPSLTRREIAARLGKSVQYTSVSVRKQGLNILTGRPEMAEQVPAIDLSKLQVAKPRPAVPATGFTLRHRVEVVHQQHPTWTAALIAKHLGANLNSVMTYLAKIRNSVAEPAQASPSRVLPNGAAGEVETRLREEARQRSARLGKPL